MEIINKVVACFLFSTFAFCQQNQLKGNIHDTIKFSFNERIYNKIAHDSILVLFNKQKDFYSNKKQKNDNSSCPKLSVKSLISLNYNFNELSYFPIPRYRLYNYDGDEEFDCNSMIENYIVFEEYNKYQYSLLKNKSVILNKIEIPNNIFEFDRIYTPNFFTKKLKTEYVDNYINSLIDISEIYKPYFEKIIKNENFYFEIYGLKNVLFEIEIETGLLFANFSSYDFGDSMNQETRTPANYFIRKYLGAEIIKKLCKGNYIEVDNQILSEGYNPCLSIDPSNRNIYLKVIRVK